MRSELTASNSIAFCVDDYHSKEEMFKAVATVMDILTQNKRYQCAFRYDDAGVYVLEFDYDDPEMGTPMCYWLDATQSDCLYTSRYIGDEDVEE